jgi:NAD(P)H-hydrate epimerase
MEILSSEQMREVDRRAIEELAIPSLRLMEAAGRGVAHALLADYPHAAETGALLLCGKGNNGGDGLVVARHLAARGVAPRIWLFCAAEQLRGDAAANCAAARHAGLDILEIPDDAAWDRTRQQLGRHRIAVDALLGTGVRGGAHGLVARAIGDLNKSGLDVVSVDLPSGANGDSGDLSGEVVSAQRTYTLCRPKRCLVLEPAASRAGRWRVVPIGIPPAVIGAVGSYTRARTAISWRSPAQPGRAGRLCSLLGGRCDAASDWLPSPPRRRRESGLRFNRPR